MTELTSSLRQGIADMKDEIEEEQEQEDLSEDQIHNFAQNAKQVNEEQEKRLEEIKKSEDSTKKDFNADQKQQVDLDEKYKNLLKKINKAPACPDPDAVSSQNEEQEQSDDDDEKKANDKLKYLYDSSVAFKNDLSNLRVKIKGLNQKTIQYTSKCTDF